MHPTSCHLSLRRLGAIALFSCVALLASPVVSQSQERLIDMEPHDLLTIPDGTGTKTIQVFPVRLPNRRLPKNPKPSDKIRVRLLEDEESRDFEVQWHDVKKLELFEDRVLAEAEALAASQKFDDAYANYAYLLKNFPNTLRLEESIQSYWYLSAGASYREKRYDEALSVLEELLKRNPAYKHGENSPSLMRVLGEIVDKLVQGHLDQGNYGPARQIVLRIVRAYPDAKSEPFYARYEERVRTAAEKKRDEALDHLAAKRYTEAYDATAAMMEIWPTVSGAADLAARMAQEYPLAVVAVDRFSTSPNALRIDRWADLRAGRLTDRRLVELRGIGPEGGDYVSPLGTCQRSEDGRSLMISLRPDAPLKAFDVLQLLMAGAQSDSSFFSAAWAQVLGGARIVKAGQVEAALQRTHVLPQALLAFPLSGDASQASSYVLEPLEEKRARFVWPAEAPTLAGKPREIQERLYDDPEAAILALARGEVDAMDRIQPSDLAAVRALPGLSVGRYAVPTVHVLVPNFDRPWPANRTFRRAVMYGTHREAILQQGVLRDTVLPGAKLVSGPFPAPLAQNDPLSYAYDDDVEPHAYEPLLAVTLLTLAKRESEATARTKNEEPPKFNGIVIGHLPLELHRIACNAMAKQLTALGIGTTTLELNSEESATQCDFVYAELLVTEPAIDVGRLFGPSGMYPAENSHVRLGVRLVEQATTWNQAGQRLRSLHRTLHEDLTVLPLWQTPEHFAVRQNLKGVSTSPVSLYQDVDQWRVTPRLEQN